MTLYVIVTLCSLFQKWRRRWFVLQQGKLPRQYLLNYYQDDTKKKLKGTIALDDCEQVRHFCLWFNKGYGAHGLRLPDKWSELIFVTYDL